MFFLNLRLKNSWCFLNFQYIGEPPKNEETSNESLRNYAWSPIRIRIDCGWEIKIITQMNILIKTKSLRMVHTFLLRITLDYQSFLKPLYVIIRPLHNFLNSLTKNNLLTTQGKGTVPRVLFILMDFTH